MIPCELQHQAADEIDSLQDQIAGLTRKLDFALEALDKIGAPKRPDGTYNYCREACERLANEALAAIKEK